ncbi:hypothetical protein ON010_g10020 [Phytophthora cinnamomi]|nr:hypothetical protein ON010_g10020 [Phytophthora cinnamomi]
MPYQCGVRRVRKEVPEMPTAAKRNRAKRKRSTLHYPLRDGSMSTPQSLSVSSHLLVQPPKLPTSFHLASTVLGIVVRVLTSSLLMVTSVDEIIGLTIGEDAALVVALSVMIDRAACRGAGLLGEVGGQEARALIADARADTFVEVSCASSTLKGDTQSGEGSNHDLDLHLEQCRVGS